jgi:hypothetical protein
MSGGCLVGCAADVVPGRSAAVNPRRAAQSGWRAAARPRILRRCSPIRSPRCSPASFATSVSRSATPISGADLPAGSRHSLRRAPRRRGAAPLSRRCPARGGPHRSGLARGAQPRDTEAERRRRDRGHCLVLRGGAAARDRPGNRLPRSWLPRLGFGLISNFAAGRFVGTPLLQWYGMTFEPRLAQEQGVEPFPFMLKWLR